MLKMETQSSSDNQVGRSKRRERGVGGAGLARRLVTYKGWQCDFKSPNPLHLAKAGLTKWYI